MNVLLDVSTGKLLCELLCHCADVSNPCKPWDIGKRWTDLINEEFYAQGDQEVLLDLPRSPLMQRDTTKPAETQMQFIDFVITPLFELFHQLIPRAKSVFRLLNTNRMRWENLRTEQRMNAK